MAAGMEATVARSTHDAALRILVVEDDERVAEVAGRYLQREGFAVQVAHDGRRGLAHATLEPPDLVVLDLALPGLDGLDVLRALRAIGGVPVIVISARGEESDRVAGLRAGADDYLVKPFSARELAARVQAVLRRSAPAREPEQEPPTLTFGAVEVDRKGRVVRIDGAEVALTALEYDLLEFLACHPGQVFRREALLEHVWGYREGDISTVTVHIHRLREKIEADPSTPTRIKTVWGVGYRFDA
jgi:DNA-binding response OmpR family regulator